VIRAYLPDDLPAVVSVFQRAVRETAAADYTAEQVSAWAPEDPDLAAWASRLEDGGVFVCVRDGRIAGFARVDEAGCVDLLFVDPALQRRGIASELLAAVRDWAVARGIDSLRAHVSITARPFFERSGFAVLRPNIAECRGVALSNFVMEMRL